MIRLVFLLLFLIKVLNATIYTVTSFPDNVIYSFQTNNAYYGDYASCVAYDGTMKYNTSGPRYYYYKTFCTVGASQHGIIEYTYVPGTPCSGVGHYNNYYEHECVCNDPDLEWDGSTCVCPALQINYVVASDVPQNECYTENPAAVPPDGQLFYLDYIVWDSCRNTCTAHRAYCPKGQNIQSGVCKEPTPDYGQCVGTVYCHTKSVAIIAGEDYISKCAKECHCLQSYSDTPNSDNLISSTNVSCSETEELPKDPTPEPTPDEIPDRLTELNGTIQADNAESVKAALESYQVAKEGTQQEQLSELKGQSGELAKQTEALESIDNKMQSLTDLAEMETAAQQMTNAILSDIQNKMATVAQEPTQLQVSDKLSEIRDKTATAQDIQDAMLNALEAWGGDLNGTGTGDENTTTDDNTTADDNGTGDGDGWGIEDVENKMAEQFTTVRQIFSTDCGTPLYDPDVEMFGGLVTFPNPLPVFDSVMESYYGIIKNFFILVATLLGLLMIFRR